MSIWGGILGGGGSGLVGTIGQGVSGNTSGAGWGGFLSSVGGALAGSGGSSSGGWLSNLFGGGSGSGGGNIWSGILGGLGTAAQAYMDAEAVEEQGRQQRRTLDFGASLEDYYTQKDKGRKRAALDTFGQFSLMDRWAPNRTAAAPLDQPARPGV